MIAFFQMTIIRYDDTAVCDPHHMNTFAAPSAVPPGFADSIWPFRPIRKVPVRVGVIS